MSLNLDEKLAHVGNRMPANLLRALLRTSLSRRHVALMFHRVRSPGPGDINAALCIGEHDLDAAIGFLLASYPRRQDRWLTVTVDDGYADAAAYVESHARRFPTVDFILFVCPEKAERGVGFRWDLAEMYRQAGEPVRRIAEVLEAPQFPDSENSREDLRLVAADPRFRLASVERLRALAGVSNVSIGNHTNSHFELSLLRPDEARLEIERSTASFERLFGRQRQFAFPFGHGFFDEDHVRVVRGLGDSVIWGTGQSPYWPADRQSGALLPRIGIDGPSRSFRAVAAVIAGRSLATRALGVRPVARRGRRRPRQIVVR